MEPSAWLQCLMCVCVFVFFNIHLPIIWWLKLLHGICQRNETATTYRKTQKFFYLSSEAGLFKMNWCFANETLTFSHCVLFISHCYMIFIHIIWAHWIHTHTCTINLHFSLRLLLNIYVLFFCFQILSVFFFALSFFLDINH